MIKVGDMMNYDSKKLKESYQEALNDKEFKEFIDKIKIPEEILMKYTSTLEECSKEFHNCLNCPSLNACQNQMLGYAYLPRMSNGILQFHYKPCKYKTNQDKKYHFLKNIKYYNLPKNYIDASWSKVDKRLASRKDTILWLNNFINNPTGKGLYLTGNFGCGKTYLIVATFNELAKKNIKSAVIFWPEFLRDLKASFNDNYDEKFDYVKEVPLLLIDDLGAETVSPWSRDEILCSILQHRMDNDLTTFITSNFSIANLEQHLAQTKDGVELVKAKRIIERIKYINKKKEMISKNMRNIKEEVI